MSLQNDRSCYADPHAEINVTPLIDVMLALVVVFMIAAPMICPQDEVASPLPLAAAARYDGFGGRGAAKRWRSDGALSWNDKRCRRTTASRRVACTSATQ